MIRSIFFISAFFLIRNSYAWSEIQCSNVGGDASTISVDEIQIRMIDHDKAEIIMDTSFDKEIFSMVACKKEASPENILACEHDRFVLIIALDEAPMAAALNPFVVKSKEYGPFYFVCKH